MIIDEERSQPCQMTGGQYRHNHGDHTRRQAVSGPCQSSQEATKRQQIAKEAVGDESRYLGWLSQVAAVGRSPGGALIVTGP